MAAAGASCALTAAAAAQAPDPFAQLPMAIELNGVVRDFRASVNGGHPDFERQPTSGYGHYAGMVGNNLDAEDKPGFASAGYKVTKEWKNAAGKNIMDPRAYIAARPGDVAGLKASTTGGSGTTGANFAKWFRDVPGVNMSDTVALTLRRASGTNKYVFDDKLDPTFQSLGGFFPINGNLYGNYSSTGKNFHFTYELDATFRYKKGAGQSFTFIGDDDVWVFIDGKLVIDIGGVHTAVQQTIDVDRLDWLVDEETYDLRFFFAERHTTQSNFRIETTLNLTTVAPPATSALYD